MATRLRQRHQDEIKQKIQGSQLVNLLQEHALTGEFQGQEVSATRIDAAKFLLNKIISNAPQLTEITGEDGGAIEVKHLTDEALVKIASGG
jgi:hypothetical protein